MSEFVLEMEEIHKSFPGVKALDNVKFNLKLGEVHALLGENGAGKSTLIKILMGIFKQDSGNIFIEGKPVQVQNPRHAAQLGVSAVFQELSLVPNLTVAENIFLCKEHLRLKVAIDRKVLLHETKKMFDEYDIDIEPHKLVQDLSMASRQLVEIMKGILVEPKLLILDEPTASLAQSEVETLFAIVEKLRSRGVGIIYISHRLDEIFRIANRVSILRDGFLVSENNIEELDFDEIVRLMVGRNVELHQRISRAERNVFDEVVLQVENLNKNNKFSNINLELKKGEILGVAGLVGSGRTEFMNMIFGIDPSDSGEIYIEGKLVKIDSVATALEHGIAMIPENRHLQGVILPHTIEQNMALPVLKLFEKYFFLIHSKLRKYVDSKIGLYNIKTESSRKIVSALSGGNQQKVVIAKWLATDPKILIVDEPTVGIDVYSKSEIHKIIRGLAQEGLAVIMISSEMSELLVNSDRIIVMNGYKILGSLEEPDQEEIMSMIMKDKLNEGSKTA